jgi:hypothetical protein
MAPEWVGDVMNSAIGWLLDVTVEQNAATLWIKTTEQININQRVGSQILFFESHNSCI